MSGGETGELLPGSRSHCEAGLSLDELTGGSDCRRRTPAGLPTQVNLQMQRSPKELLSPQGCPQRCRACRSGNYFLGSDESGQEIVVEDGVAWLPDRSAFAGSVVTGTQLLKTMVELAGKYPLSEAVKMATITPARILNVDDSLGSLDPGKYADITVSRTTLQLSIPLSAAKSSILLRKGGAVFYTRTKKFTGDKLRVEIYPNRGRAIGEKPQRQLLISKIRGIDRKG